MKLKNLFSPLKPLLFLCVMLGTGGCVNTWSKRVVLVPEEKALFLLSEDVEAYVFFWNGKEWERSSKKILLRSGWAVGSMPSEN